MAQDAKYRKNDRAFRQMKREIDVKFRAGQFVAFDDGEIVADAPTYAELTGLLAAQGRDRADIFVARAGEDYPEFADILDR